MPLVGLPVRGCCILAVQPGSTPGSGFFGGAYALWQEEERSPAACGRGLKRALDETGHGLPDRIRQAFLVGATLRTGEILLPEAELCEWNFADEA